MHTAFRKAIQSLLTVPVELELDFIYSVTDGQIESNGDFTFSAKYALFSPVDLPGDSVVYAKGKFVGKGILNTDPHGQWYTFEIAHMQPEWYFPDQAHNYELLPEGFNGLLIRYVDHRDI